MTVYEIIQILSKFNADDEVVFHVDAKHSANVEAEFDRDNESDTQEVTVDIEFDEDVEFDGTRNNYWNKNQVIFDLKY